VNAGGLVLALLGIWLVAQILVGRLLQRLGILPSGG
jgi:hypothetical protein